MEHNGSSNDYSKNGKRTPVFFEKLVCRIHVIYSQILYDYLIGIFLSELIRKKMLAQFK